jgi:hypothetical protein
MATYTASNIVVLTGNTNLFINGLVQQILAQPNIINDTGWFANLSNVQTLLDGAENAGYYSQQVNAQTCLDLDFNYIANQQYFF